MTEKIVVPYRPMPPKYQGTWLLFMTVLMTTTFIGRYGWPLPTTVDFVIEAIVSIVVGAYFWGWVVWRCGYYKKYPTVAPITFGRVCTKCSAVLADGSKFCAACAARVTAPVIEESSSSAGPAITIVKPRSVGAYVLDGVLMLLLCAFYSEFLFSGITGTPLGDASNTNGSSVLAVGGLTYWLARRHKTRRPWVWVVSSIVAIFIVIVVGGFIHGWQRQSQAAASQVQLEEVFFASAEKFDPVAGATLRDARNDRATFPKLLAPFVVRAVLVAPDANVIALMTARERTFAPKTPDDISRCTAAAHGTGFTGIPLDAQNALMRTESALFVAAAKDPVVPTDRTGKAALALMVPIYKEIDPANALGSDESFAKLTGTEQCQMYLSLLAHLHALAPADQATVFRYMWVGQQ